MNLYEIMFKDSKEETYLFESEMDLGQIAMMLNSDIVFFKIGNQVSRIEEVAKVEISDIKTVNEEMYNRMKPDIPVIEFPVFVPTVSMMKEYQKKVERTRNYDNTELANYTLGLVCESGEVGDIIKKHLYHGHDLDKNKIVSELGDVMWYLNNICNVLDISIEEVAKSNIEKLMKRYPDGFSKNDSINRDENIF
ncbi:nucleoside triphosphate pyrophosphohydrolase family protein [Romboutsia lituseburensis]|uniref:nucleoside triphosphate pyrophosphohydrolase family protein n=1 Tax=Romboutsia lituseburensis TaxID=1537 RepID=UPI0022EA2F0E|nr:nucleoside triphosphate pyrophosphohydrolase family protein [Romboutsia lituseburensis]